MNLLLLELIGQDSMGALSKCQNHQTGGVHVQPVDGWLSDDVWKNCFYSINDTILFVNSPARYREESTRFFNQRQLRVGIYYFKVQFFRQD